MKDFVHLISLYSFAKHPVEYTKHNYLMQHIQKCRKYNNHVFNNLRSFLKHPVENAIV